MLTLQSFMLAFDHHIIVVKRRLLLLGGGRFESDEDTSPEVSHSRRLGSKLGSRTKPPSQVSAFNAVASRLIQQQRRQLQQSSRPTSAAPMFTTAEDSVNRTNGDVWSPSSAVGNQSARSPGSVSLAVSAEPTPRFARRLDRRPSRPNVAISAVHSGIVTLRIPSARMHTTVSPPPGLPRAPSHVGAVASAVPTVTDQAEGTTGSM